MPDVVHQLEKVFGGSDDERTYCVTFHDSDVFRLRQCQPSSHSSGSGSPQWLAEIVERVASGPLRSHFSFTAGDFLEIAESDITEVVDEQTGQRLYIHTDGTPTI
jgi:hypothetical protein